MQILKTLYSSRMYHDVLWLPYHLRHITVLFTVFCKAGPPRRVDCLSLRIQQQDTASGVEGFANLHFTVDCYFRNISNCKGNISQELKWQLLSTKGSILVILLDALSSAYILKWIWMLIDAKYPLFYNTNGKRRNSFIHHV